MALRISKKEMEELQNLITKAKRKYNRLKRTYGLINTFKFIDLPKIITRSELNTYKRQLKRYLLRTTHHYKKGGTYISYRPSTMGKLYYYPIPMEDVREIRKLIKERNDSIKRQQERFKRVSYEVKAEKQDITLNDRMRSIVNPNFKKLGAKYGSYFPIKFQPANISSDKSLKRFKYALKQFQTHKSIAKKQHQAKVNYINALANTFGNAALPLIELIEELTDEQFIEFFESEDYAEFGYIYDPELASEVINYLTEHFIHYIDEQNIELDKRKVDTAIFVSELDSSILLSEYNKGSLGGQRITFKMNKNNAKTRYYIDLTEEEYQQYLGGKSVTEFSNFEERKKQLNLYRYK